VRHKKGYSTVAILIVAFLFITAAVIHQSSTVQTIAYHPPSLHVPPNFRRQENSSIKTLTPSPDASTSPEQVPTFSEPTIFFLSITPTPTVSQPTAPVETTRILKPQK